MKQNYIPKNGVKRGKKVVNHAIKPETVAAFVSFLPYFRRLQRTYRLKHVSPMFAVLLAHNGFMTVTGLCRTYYGDTSTTPYRSTQYGLETLKRYGLAESVGGKWHLTEKGMRELGLID